MRTIGLAAVLAFSVVAVFSAVAQGAELVSHFVDYQVDYRNLPSEYEGAGVWQTSIVNGCKYWQVKKVIGSNISTGNRTQSTISFQEGFESIDGLKATYVITMGNDVNPVKYRTYAAFADKNAPGTMSFQTEAPTSRQVVDFNSSRPRTIDMPAKVLMMAQTIQYMIDRLADGQTDFTLKTIDPTGRNDGSIDIRVELLTKPPATHAQLPANDDGLFAGRFWWVRITRDGDDLTPVMIMQLFDNGVAGRILTSISAIELEITARTLVRYTRVQC